MKVTESDQGHLVVCTGGTIVGRNKGPTRVHVAHSWNRTLTCTEVFESDRDGDFLFYREKTLVDALKNESNRKSIQIS